MKSKTIIVGFVGKKFQEVRRSRTGKFLLK